MFVFKLLYICFKYLFYDLVFKYLLTQGAGSSLSNVPCEKKDILLFQMSSRLHQRCI